MFGCDPCPVAHHESGDAADFPAGIVPFIGPEFFTGYLQPAGKSKYSYTAADEETWLTLRVQRRVSFASPDDRYTVGLAEARNRDWFEVRELGVYLGALP